VADHLWQDLRYAARALVAHPWISGVAIITLAVGISVNTVVFSVINGLLLKGPAPGAAEIDSLVRVFTGVPNDPYDESSCADFMDLAAEAQSFDLAAEGFLPLAADVGGRATQVWTLLVSPNYFSVLGVEPAMGRLPGRDLDRDESVAVVSHAFWNRRLDAAPDLVGRFVVLNGRSFPVVGVLPEGFHGPGGIYVPDVWVPLTAVGDLGLPEARTGRDLRWLRLVGRLREGTSLAQAQAEVATLVERLAAAYPAIDKGRFGTVAPLTAGYPDEHRAMQAASALALGATGIVLLIACFNVAGVLLARAVDRQREMGIRASLGASRVRLLRQLVTESLLLAALAGAAGFVVSIWSAGALDAFAIPAPIPQAIDLGVDLRTIAFVALLVVVGGVVPGLAPALHASRPDLVDALKADASTGAAAGRPAHLRDLFLVLQIAGSTAFLSLAALFVQSYVHTARADLGFDTSHTLVMTLDQQLHGYQGARARTLFETLSDRVRALPGVDAVALTSWVPFSVGSGARSVPVSADGRDCAEVDCVSAQEVAVTPGYPTALGVRMVEGRDLRPGDRTAPSAVVNQSMAASLWPGRNPVGEIFYAGTGGTRLLWHVVGVVADIRAAGPGRPARPLFSRIITGGDMAGDRAVWLVARSGGNPDALIEPVRQVVASVDRTLPVAQIETMRTHLELPLWQGRVLVAFFTLCGGVALLFASVGLFGVTHYTIGQRTREFGIRLALGATARQVMGEVLRDGVRLAALGPSDPTTYAAILLVQALVAVGAGLLPARRATRIDPALALRRE
jgi:predicted permease